VTHRVWSWARERREAELAKCVVRCVACHLVKTRLRGENPGCPPGEGSPRAKLTEAAVREIRASSESGYALAKQYGVNSGTISLIKRRLTWSHLPD